MMEGAIVHTGSAKQRRDQLKVLTEELGAELPFDYGKISQLRTLKAACAFLRKIKHFSNFVKRLEQSVQSDAEITLNFAEYRHQNEQRISNLLASYEVFLNEGLLGFFVCFSRKGELIYLSENIIDYLGFKSMEILLSYDFIYEIAHDQDRQAYENLLNNSQNYVKSKQMFSMFSLWFVSKIKRKSPPMSEYKLFKMAGHFDPETDMFIMKCSPILSIGNRDSLIASEAKYFSSAHHLNLKFSELSRNGETLLGYNNRDFDSNANAKFQNLTLYDVVCPDYLKVISERHSYLLRSKDLKGFLDPIKLIHADGTYVDCLLNMYFDNRGFIICKYQAMSLQDIIKYNDYVAKLDQDWFLNSVSSSESNSGLNDSTYGDLDDDLSEELSTPRSHPASRPKHRFSMEEQINVNVGMKRKFHSFDSAFGDEYSIEIDNKFLKRNEDFGRVDEEPLDSKENIFDLTQNNVNVMMRNKPVSDPVKRLSSQDVIEINNIKNNLEEEIKSMYLVTNGQHVAYSHQQQQMNHPIMMIPNQFSTIQPEMSAGFSVPLMSATDTPDLSFHNGQSTFKKEPEVQQLGLEKLFNDNVNNYNAPSASFLDYDNHEIDETALQNFIRFEESFENLNTSLSTYKANSQHQELQEKLNPVHQSLGIFDLSEEDLNLDTKVKIHANNDKSYHFYQYWNSMNQPKLEHNEF